MISNRIKDNEVSSVTYASHVGRNTTVLVWDMERHTTDNNQSESTAVSIGSRILTRTRSCTQQIMCIRIVLVSQGLEALEVASGGSIMDRRCTEATRDMVDSKFRRWRHTSIDQQHD